MRRPTVTDIAAGMIVLALAVFTLAPVLARIQRTPAEARCQANLQRIAEALTCYLADNDGRFPTNRPLRGTVLMSINWAVGLSPLPKPGEEPVRFVYGLNWVEALYDYTEAERMGQVGDSCWRCPNASNTAFPTGVLYSNPRVTYAFNSCLAEQPGICIREGRNLMMLREFSRLTVSTLRPMNTASSSSTGNGSHPPRYPFLNNRDINFDTSGECRLHGEGSYIVFADGHIRHFALEYYPESSSITAGRCWDESTQQWYNYCYSSPTTPDQKRLNKSIAITP